MGGLISGYHALSLWSQLDTMFWNTIEQPLKRFTISSANDYDASIHPGVTGNIEISRAGGTVTIQQFIGIDNTIFLRSYNPQASTPKWSKWTKI